MGAHMIKSIVRLIFIVTCFQASMSWSVYAKDPALESCVSSIDNGAYPSGIEQAWCEANFDLPDPFVLTCLGRIEQGQWTDDIEKTACQILLTDLITRQYSDYLKQSTRLANR